MSAPSLKLFDVDESRREAFLTARSEVFGYGEITPENTPDWSLNVARYVAMDGDEPVGTSAVLRYQFTRGEAILPAGGVAAVGIRPTYRNQKLGSWLMREVLHRMRDDERMVIAALYPYRETFYRRFGYETCGFRMLIKCPTERLPKLLPELEPRRIRVDQLGEIDACYRAFAHRYSGANIRTPEQWKIRMGKRAPMIFAFGDPVEAYCWTSSEGGFWEDLKFGELVWNTDRGYRSILAFIRGMVINQTSAEWMEPTPSPFVAQFLDQSITAELHRPAMYRILDFSKAVALLKPSQTGSFCFELHDADLKENAGVWRVEFSPDGCQATRDGSEPDFRLTIQQLTQVFLGQPSLQDLVQLQQVDVLNPAGIVEATKLWSPMPVLCTEFF